MELEPGWSRSTSNRATVDCNYIITSLIVPVMVARGHSLWPAHFSYNMWVQNIQYEALNADLQCNCCRPDVYFEALERLVAVSDLRGLEGWRTLTSATGVSLREWLQHLQTQQGWGYKTDYLHFIFGLLPVQHQGITWTNPGLLSTGILGTNFSEIWIGILPLTFKKIYLKMSAKMVAILSRWRWVNNQNFSYPQVKSKGNCTASPLQDIEFTRNWRNTMMAMGFSPCNVGLLQRWILKLGQY